jgi:hypothetical protein
MWDIIHNEIGNTKFIMDNIEITDGSNLMMNPQSISDKEWCLLGCYAVWLL